MESSSQMIHYEEGGAVVLGLANYYRDHDLQTTERSNKKTTKRYRALGRPLKESFCDSTMKSVAETGIVII